MGHENQYNKRQDFNFFYFAECYLKMGNYREMENYLFYVLCPFRIWTIKVLHIFLSFITIRNVCLLAVPPFLFLAIHLYELVSGRLFLPYVQSVWKFSELSLCVSEISNLIKNSIFIFIISLNLPRCPHVLSVILGILL